MVPNPTAVRSKAAPVQVPITSRWCNRALRPLTSIYLRLEKHWKTTPVETEDYIRRTYKSEQKRLKPRRDERGGLSGSESSRDDPTWVPGMATKKRIKHRYSGRRGRASAGGRSKSIVRSPESEKLQPGEFSIATPLILGKGRRTIDDLHRGGDSTLGTDDGRRAGSPQRKPPCMNWTRHHEPNEISDTYSDPFYLEIVQSIISAWDIFLRVSSPQRNRNHGARSLLSMALKKTSEYILEEQEYANNSNDKAEEQDAADHIFTELEATYALGNEGWKPLRELVRLHGIHLICETIRRKWISPQLALQLVLGAIHSSSNDAATALLSTLLSVSPTISPPSHLKSVLFSPETSIALYTCHKFAQNTGSFSFLFQELASLLIRNLLPPEWMATDSMKPILSRALQSISYGDDHSSDAVNFVMAIVSTASGANDSPASAMLRFLRRPRFNSSRVWSVAAIRPRNKQALVAAPSEELSVALNNSVFSILAVFLGAHFAQFGFGTRADSTMHFLVVNISTKIQKTIEQHTYDQNPNNNKITLHWTRSCAVLMADFSLSFLDDPAVCSTDKLVYKHVPVLDNIGYLIRGYSDKKELMCELSTLVLHIARCLGRVQDDDGFDVVKRFTEAFERIDSKIYPTVRIIFSKLAIDVALSFAELTCLREHHDWASYIQDKLASYELDSTDLNSTEPLSPSLRQSASGFRWEDGIGEWVAKSPSHNLNQSSTSHRPSQPTIPRERVILASDSSEAEDSEEDSNSTFSFHSVQDESSVTSASPPPDRKTICSSSKHQYTYTSSKRASRAANATSENLLRRSKRQKTRHLSLEMNDFSGSIGRWSLGVSRGEGSRRRKSSPLPTTPRPRRRRGQILQSNQVAKPANSIVAVEVPPPSNRASNVEVVIVHQPREANASSHDDEITPPYQLEELEAESEYVEDSEDDLFSKVPSLGERVRRRLALGGYSAPSSSSSSFSSSSSLSQLNHNHNVHRKQSSANYPLRSTRQSFAKRVIPCSESYASSDDELSFV